MRPRRGIESINKQDRNQLALAIFTKHGFSVRTLGNDESPMFIMEDKYLLSCFVNMGSLHFRPSPDSGEITRTIKLTGDAYVTKYEIEELIERSEHLPVYRVQHADSGMCIVGYNKFDPDEEISEGFPVFANYNPIIYVNPEKAEAIAKEYTQKGYNLKVI